MIDWIRDNLCPGLPPFGATAKGPAPKWLDRRVLVFTENREGTKRHLKAILEQAIEKNIEQFYVFEIDENIIACVSLHLYPDKPKYAEVGSLYVMPFYHHRGIGKIPPSPPSVPTALCRSLPCEPLLKRDQRLVRAEQ